MAPLSSFAAHNITHVLIPAFLGRESSENTPHVDNGIAYLHLYVADMAGFPILPLLEEAFEFLSPPLDRGESVLIHCAQGVSRSAAFTTALLMQRESLSCAAAAKRVTDARPIADPLRNFGDQLLAWEQAECTPSSLPPSSRRRSPFSKTPLFSSQTS